MAKKGNIFDSTEHILVPKHTKISEKEKKALLEKFNISLSHLPRIHKNDPAVAHLKLEIGDVVKINRQSPTAKEAVYYRGVIS